MLERAVIETVVDSLIEFDPKTNMYSFFAHQDETGAEYEQRSKDSILAFNDRVHNLGLSFYLNDTLVKVPKQHLSYALSLTKHQFDSVLIKVNSLQQRVLDHKIYPDKEIKMLNKKPLPFDENDNDGFCGLASFSRVVFNSKLDKALVYYFHSRTRPGRHDSAEYFVLLGRRNSTWAIIQRIKL